MLAFAIVTLLLAGTAHASTGGVTLSGPNSGITVPTWDDFTALVDRVADLEGRVEALEGELADTAGSDDGADAGSDGDTDDGAVDASAPEATYDYAPQDPLTGEAVAFDAAASECAATPCEYVWHDVVDGDEWALGEGQTLEFAFADAGDKHVRLTVTDDAGQADATTQVVTVTDDGTDDGTADSGDDTGGDDTGGDDTAGGDTDDGTSSDSEEVATGRLRDGFGGTSRPSGDEFAIPAGFPHGGNTGFAASQLSAGDLEDVGTLVLDTPGETVSGVRAKRIEVNADNVTVTDSIVEGSSLYAVDAYRSGQTGFTMERVDVHQTDPCRKAVYARNTTLDDVNAWGGDTVAVLRSNVTVRDSFIHDPSDDCDGRHYDAVHSQGAEHLHLHDSTLLTRWRQQTAAAIVQSNQSAVDDFQLAGSFLSGGTYTLYVRERNHGVPTNVVVSDNVWQADSWQYGTHSTNRDGSWTWSGNHDTNGTVVD